MVLLLPQGLAICVFLHVLLGLAEGSRTFSWDLTNHEFERVTVDSLTVCDSLYISLSSSLDGYIGQSPYTLFAFEAGGVLTATQIHEDGLWQVKHPTGSQLLLALVDSLGNSGGVLPTVFTVASGPSDCLPALPTSAFAPMIITSVDQIEPCDSWNLSISGGVPPYTIMLASPGAPFLQDFYAPQESSPVSFINSGIALRGPTIAAVRDSSGVFGHATEFVEVVDASGVSCEVGSRRERAGIMILAARSNGTVKISHQDTIIIAVCASVGGTMILAVLCFAVVMFRRRKRGLIAGQDARPRPFEPVNQAPYTNASVPRANASVPLSVIDISWRNNLVVSPTEASSTRSPVGPKSSPSRTHTRPLPVPTASRQPSNTSLRSPEDSPSRPPRNPSSPYIAQSPQSGSSSRIPRQQQSNSSMHSANNNHRPTNSPMSPQRSAVAQEAKRSNPRSRTERHKRTLHGSRSTGDIPRDNMAPPSHRQHATVPRSSSDMRHTNHLRHYYSASNVTHTNRSAVEPAGVYQHRGGGDPPPPYHKLRPLGR
ncbi:hypothetical protein DEU56DRAFT_557861 [Suillus clintonianus]|uniref:uncharacterized protein n=1 Tax=Suillus clintonianus TaxID=1904413 RepID=UPI001B8674D8|nr:uncharacterized protein DEU56DRAFT_557861 [Suillus clintonianus]KAG2126038.1 hypothetical protein DEU56DRAFT_557861 [Suillus clintonianus]